MRSETYFKKLATTAANKAKAQAGRAGAATAAAASAVGAGAPAPGPAGAAAAALAPAPPPLLVLLAEPHFGEFEQLVPWAHLKFWRDFDVLRGSLGGGGGGSAAGAVGGSGGAAAPLAAGRPVACAPARARLCAAAASLPELWRTRRALGIVEGVDLSPANAVLGVVGGGNDAAPVAAGSDGGDDDDGSDGWGGPRQHQQQLPILPYSVRHTMPCSGAELQPRQRPCGALQLGLAACSGPVGSLVAYLRHAALTAQAVTHCCCAVVDACVLCGEPVFPPGAASARAPRQVWQCGGSYEELGPRETLLELGCR